jgi:hypothetical protein
VGERDRDSSAGANGSTFDAYADHACVLCSGVAEKRTAELIYMSQQWDYFYCYRCRGWFKRHYGDPRVYLPVRDKAQIKHLTWFYTSHLESVYERRKFFATMENVWRVLERRLLHA